MEQESGERRRGEAGGVGTKQGKTESVHSLDRLQVGELELGQGLGAVRGAEHV